MTSSSALAGGVFSVVAMRPAAPNDPQKRKFVFVFEAECLACGGLFTFENDDKTFDMHDHQYCTAHQQREPLRLAA